MPKNNSSKNSLSFVAMASTYCLGAFNDNFFKQAAMLLAVSIGASHLQGYATVLFSLPFILFSAYGGWCADKFSKKKVIVVVKGVEVLAMLVGGLGLMLESWPLIMSMIFLMGIQSTFFSPALNGSIPELYSTDQVPRINGILKLTTTLAILLGIALAGVSLDQQWIPLSSMPVFRGHQVAFGVVLVAAVALLVSLIGFFSSFALGMRPAAGGSRNFPWSGPWRSLMDLVDISADKQLMLGILCDAWFYFISLFAVLLINTLSISQFGFSQTATSLLSMLLMLGVCVGSLLAVKFTTAETWNRYLKLSAFSMGLFLFLAGCAPLFPSSLSFAWLSVTLIMAGCAGGIFIIPTATILQVRPRETEKGRVLAVSSFSSFITILFAGILFSLLDGLCSPANLMLAAGVAAMVFAFSLGLLIELVNYEPKRGLSPRILVIFEKLLKSILGLRYKIEVKGLDTIEKRGPYGILFLPNHPALIDPVIVYSRLLSRFTPRPLSDANQLDSSFIRLFSDVLNPITIPDSRIDGASAPKKILKGMQMVVAGLKAGDNILFYPAGRLNRGARESLGENSGVEYILRKIPEVQVVTVRTTGLWGSSFGYGAGRPKLFSQITKYLAALAAGFLFFVPKRPVTILFREDTAINQLNTRKEINRHLEEFYNALPVKNLRYPLFWWQGRKPEIMPEPAGKNGPDL